MSKTHLMLLCTALAIVLLPSAGCMKCGRSLTEKAMESAIEKAVEKSTGGKVNIDGGSNVDISDLPEILRYPGAKAIARWTITHDEGSGTVYTLETGDAKNTVADHYKRVMAGWKQSVSAESGDGITLIYVDDKEDRFVSIVVGPKDEGAGSTIGLTYTKK